MEQSCYFYSLLGENDIYRYCKRNGNKIENCYYCVTKMVSFYCFTQKNASSGILRKSLIASRSFESSQIWVFSPWVLLLNADAAAAAVNGARKLRTTNRNRRYWVCFVTNWRTRVQRSPDLPFFLKSAPTVGRSRPSKFLSSQAEKLP